MGYPYNLSLPSEPCNSDATPDKKNGDLKLMNWRKLDFFFFLFFGQYAYEWSNILPRPITYKDWEVTSKHLKS